jgi:hypothetical protein
LGAAGDLLLDEVLAVAFRRDVWRIGDSGGWRGVALARMLGLIVHELAHHVAANHLSDEYYGALSDLGGKLAVLALEDPAIFDFERYAAAA